MNATSVARIMLLAVVVSTLVARLTRLSVRLIHIALGAAIFYSDLVSVKVDSAVFFLLLPPHLLFLDGLAPMQQRHTPRVRSSGKSHWNSRMAVTRRSGS